MPPIRPVSPHAKTLRQNMSDAEQKFWLHVRDRRLSGFKFRRQATIGPFIADFLCAGRMLIIELDGGQHNEEVDASRTHFLEAKGYTVMRFWNNEVLTDMEGVLQVVLVHLEGAAVDYSERSARGCDTPSPNQFGVNIAPRCSGHAGGMTDPKLPQTGEG